MREYKICFIMSHVLGHITYMKNLQTEISKDPSVKACWEIIDYKNKEWPSKIPFYTNNWTVLGGLQARRIISSRMQQASVDALFFHTQVPAILAADLIKRIPSVISMDATPLQIRAMGGYYGHQSKLFKWLSYKMNCDCYKAARQLITWSEWAKCGLVNEYKVPPHKVTVIKPGIDLKFWMRPKPKTLHSEPIKILFVGGDFTRKGGPLLLDVFHKLRSLGIELHLVTKEPLLPEPNLFIYNNMQPNSDALRELYHKCDIFCLPTLGDSLGIVLMEAAAAGLPSVTTRLAATPEIVQDGKTGLLIPSGDVAALGEAIKQLVKNHDLRLKMGEEAVKLSRRDFGVEHSTFELLRVLKRVVDEG